MMVYTFSIFERFIPVRFRQYEHAIKQTVVTNFNLRVFHTSRINTCLTDTLNKV